MPRRPGTTPRARTRSAAQRGRSPQTAPAAAEAGLAAPANVGGAENGSPSEAEIRVRAFEIYLRRGGEPGHEIEDWLQAERELRREPGRQSL